MELLLHFGFSGWAGYDISFLITNTHLEVGRNVLMLKGSRVGRLGLGEVRLSFQFGNCFWDSASDELRA